MKKYFLMSLILIAALGLFGCSKSVADKPVASNKKVKTVASTEKKTVSETNNVTKNPDSGTDGLYGAGGVNSIGNSGVNLHYRGSFAEQGRNVFFTDLYNIYKMTDYNPDSVVKIIGFEQVPKEPYADSVEGLNVIGDTLYFKTKKSVFKCGLNGESLTKITDGDRIDVLYVTKNFLAYLNLKDDYSRMKTDSSVIIKPFNDGPTDAVPNYGPFFGADENRVFYQSAPKQIGIYNFKPTDMDKRLNHVSGDDRLIGAYSDLNYYVTRNGYAYSFNPYYGQVLNKIFFGNRLKGYEYNFYTTDATNLYLDLRNDKELHFVQMPFSGDGAVSHSITIDGIKQPDEQGSSVEPLYGVTQNRFFYHLLSMNGNAIYMVNLDGTGKMKFDPSNLKFVPVN